MQRRLGGLRAQSEWYSHLRWVHLATRSTRRDATSCTPRRFRAPSPITVPSAIQIRPGLSRIPRPRARECARGPPEGQHTSPPVATHEGPRQQPTCSPCSPNSSAEARGTRAATEQTDTTPSRVEVNANAHVSHLATSQLLPELMWQGSRLRKLAEG